MKKENKELKEKTEILGLQNNLLKENFINYEKFYQDISDFLWCGVCGTVTDIKINNKTSKNANKKINTSISLSKVQKSENHCTGIFNTPTNIINDNESEELSIYNSKNPLDFISKNCIKHSIKNQKGTKTVPFLKKCNVKKSKELKYMNTEFVEMRDSTNIKKMVCQRCSSDIRQQSIKNKDTKKHNDTYSKISINKFCNNSIRSMSTDKLDSTAKKDYSKTLVGKGNKTERHLKPNHSSKFEFSGGNVNKEKIPNLVKFHDTYCRNSRLNYGALHLNKKNRVKAKSVGKNLEHHVLSEENSPIIFKKVKAKTRYANPDKISRSSCIKDSFIANTKNIGKFFGSFPKDIIESKIFGDPSLKLIKLTSNKSIEYNETKD